MAAGGAGAGGDDIRTEHRTPAQAPIRIGRTRPVPTRPYLTVGVLLPAEYCCELRRPVSVPGLVCRISQGRQIAISKVFQKGDLPSTPPKPSARRPVLFRNGVPPLSPHGARDVFSFDKPAAVPPRDQLHARKEENDEAWLCQHAAIRTPESDDCARAPT